MQQMCLKERLCQGVAAKDGGYLVVPPGAGVPTTAMSFEPKQLGFG